MTSARLGLRLTVLFGTACLLFGGRVDAATVQGIITDAGRHPLVGAMMSVRDEERGFFETVYTDASGHFLLSTAQQGDLQLRARMLSYKDGLRPLHLDPTSSITADFSLEVLTDPEDIADNLSPAAHFSKIPFDATGPNSRAGIQMTCTNCHALGTAFNRMPRLPEEWAPVVSRMLSDHVGVPLDAVNELTDSRSNLFAQGFDDSLPKQKEVEQISPDLFKARITEWAIRGDTPFPFGMTVSSSDRRLYVADNGIGRLLVINPKAEDMETLTLAQPVQDIAEAPDGKMYMTAPRLGMLGALDPKTKIVTWRVVADPDLGNIRVAKDGTVWWTHYWDENSYFQSVFGTGEAPTAPGFIGQYDPKTNRMQVMKLPANTSKDYLVPSTQPYVFGIDVDPVSGDIWYSKLYANKIGHIDAKTLQVEEFTPPQLGPRGIAFDKSGTLWVAFSGSSSIASLDPKTMKWQVYPLPTLAPQESDTPYSLAVQPSTGDVWVTANEAGQMYRFVTSENRFVTYPMPTRGVWMRDIAFTNDGLVCGTSGPLPPINIEGGDPLVLCVDPGR